MTKEILRDFAKIVNSDRYQYTESEIFLKNNMENSVGVFDFYFRKTEDGGFAVVSGISEIIEFIEIINETSYETKKFYYKELIENTELLEYLCNMKFTGDIYGLKDGEICYPNEPILTIKAPLIQGKILETPILNMLNYQMAIASKTSRVTRAAGETPVSAFGTRRAHGFDSAVYGNKASIIAGCYNHSNLMTELKFGLPSIGTMSHSYIQTFGIGVESEYRAFDTFIKGRKNSDGSLVLLVDTYSVKSGVKNAIKAFKENGIDDDYKGIYGIRIDSGDLAYLSKFAKKEFLNEGFLKATITLTNGLDEDLILSLKEQGAKVDFFGVGDAIAVSKSNPCFGGVYKIVEIDEKPLIKLSEDSIKISNPGFKTLIRLYKNNEAVGDLIGLMKKDSDIENIKNLEKFNFICESERYKRTIFDKDSYTYKFLTEQFVKNGKFIGNKEYFLNIEKQRNYYLESLLTLSEEHKRLKYQHKYKVNISNDLYNMKYNLIEQINNELEGV